MGVGRRIAELYAMKVNALLDSIEDPGELLDYSYGQQLDRLRRMRAAIAEVAAGRARAAAQEAELRRSARRLESQAAQAVTAGQDELGRQALRLRRQTLAHAEDLAVEQAGMHAEQERLDEAARRLEQRTEAFRQRKDVLRAAYTSAAAAAEVTRAAGAFEDAGELAAAVRLAEDQVVTLRARADALSERLGPAERPVPAGARRASPGRGTTGAGTTSPVTPLAGQRLQEQLDAITIEAAVERDLARIRRRLASAAGKPQRRDRARHA